MDPQRSSLFSLFSFSLLLLWDAWQKELRPPTAPATQGTVPTPSGPAVTPAAKAADAMPSSAAPTGKASERLRVRTDTMLAEIDTQGGDLVYLELLKHKDTRDENKNFVLFGPEHRYSAQSGLIGTGLPNRRTLFRAKAKEFILAQDQDRLEVRLDADTAEGIKVGKILTLRRESYRIDVGEEISNGTAAPLATHAYFQLTRDSKSPGSDPYMARTYTGVALYTAQDKFQKVTFEDIAKDKAPYPKTPDNGWIAIIQHYFVAALLPPDKTPREFYTRKLSEDLYSAGVIVSLRPIAPGASAQAVVPLYAGPQDQDHLEAVAPGLELVVDYGWLTVIAAPLFWVLRLFHGWMSNWGLAIILLTVVIKLIFFPLSAATDEATRAVCGRQDEDEPSDDGALQDREDQPARRLPADPGADPGVHRSLLGAVRKRRAAPRSFLSLDQGPFGAGSLVRAADADDGLDARSDEDEPDTTRPDSGQSHDDHAVRVLCDVLLFSLGPAPILVRQQYPVDPPAMADHPHDRGEKIRRQREALRRRPIAGRYARGANRW